MIISVHKTGWRAHDGFEGYDVSWRTTDNGTLVINRGETIVACYAPGGWTKIMREDV